MDAINNVATTPFVGWFRRHKRQAWQRMTEGDSYDTTLHRLLEAVTTSGDMLVTPGTNPNTSCQPSLWPRRTSKTASGLAGHG